MTLPGWVLVLALVLHYTGVYSASWWVYLIAFGAHYLERMVFDA